MRQEYRERMRSKLVTLVILFVLSCMLFSDPVRAQKLPPCTKAENEQAESEAGNLRGWDKLYRSFKRFGRCGNVDAAERYSESIARTLVDHWDSLPRLAELAKKDKGFRSFVLAHVDATLDMKDVETIRKNASGHCPNSSVELCNDLKRRADIAIEEDRYYHKKK